MYFYFCTIFLQKESPQYRRLGHQHIERIHTMDITEEDFCPIVFLIF